LESSGRWWQEDCEFKASLGSTTKPRKKERERERVRETPSKSIAD
jgi:hypothetical protein